MIDENVEKLIHELSNKITLIEVNIRKLKPKVTGDGAEQLSKIEKNSNDCVKLLTDFKNSILKEHL